jgi:hypothetical protein
MGKYEVEITETLQKIVAIHVDNEDAAFQNVKGMYKSEKIILDSHDYIDIEISLH